MKPSLGMFTGEKSKLSVAACRFETNEKGVRILMQRLLRVVGAYRLGDRNFAGYLTDRTK